MHNVCVSTNKLPLREHEISRGGCLDIPRPVGATPVIPNGLYAIKGARNQLINLRLLFLSIGTPNVPQSVGWIELTAVPQRP